MKALMIVAMAVVMTRAARGQVIKEEPEGCLQATAHTNGPCKLTSANGTVLQTLADGTTWATVRPGTEGQVSVQVTKDMPVPGVFSTFIITNRDTDVVNGPQSDKVQIQGDCQSKTYEIMGDEGMSGKNGTGYGMETADWGDLVDAQGGRQIHKVNPGSNVEIAFNWVCRK